MRDKPVQVSSEFHWPFIAAWVCCAIFYSLQYALRSDPVSALMTPVYGWVLVAVSNGGPLDLPVFQKAGMIGVGGIVLAIVLSCFIRETGTAALDRKIGDGLQFAPVVGEAK
jgi:hypothetical protein